MKNPKEFPGGKSANDKLTQGLGGTHRHVIGRADRPGAVLLILPWDNVKTLNKRGKPGARAVPIAPRQRRSGGRAGLLGDGAPGRSRQQTGNKPVTCHDWNVRLPA